MKIYKGIHANELKNGDLAALNRRDDNRFTVVITVEPLFLGNVNSPHLLVTDHHTNSYVLREDQYVQVVIDDTDRS